MGWGDKYQKVALSKRVFLPNTYWARWLIPSFGMSQDGRYLASQVPGGQVPGEVSGHPAGWDASWSVRRCFLGACSDSAHFILITGEKSFHAPALLQSSSSQVGVADASAISSGLPLAKTMGKSTRMDIARREGNISGTFVVRLWARCLIYIIPFNLYNHLERWLLLTYYNSVLTEESWNS